MKKLAFLFIGMFASLMILAQSLAPCETCLPEGITFTTQSQLDSFQINYPGCTEIEGSVEIWGWEYIITNLNGLNVLTSIGGSLEIHGNDALTSLTGLDNLTSIGSNLKIKNNDALTSLTGLDNLISIDSNLFIWDNDALTSLTGLDNVTSIGNNLLIYFNPSLSECEVLSVCDHLASNGSVAILNNAVGCNSPEEIQDSCEANAVRIVEQNIKDILILYPNPTSQELNISAEGYNIDEVVIYTLTGQQVYEIRLEGESIDISILQPGMYIVEVMVEGRKVRRKLVVE